jgi:hypothetical protein
VKKSRPVGVGRVDLETQKNVVDERAELKPEAELSCSSAFECLVVLRLVFLGQFLAPGKRKIVPSVLFFCLAVLDIFSHQLLLLRCEFAVIITICCLLSTKRG